MGKKNFLKQDLVKIYPCVEAGKNGSKKLMILSLNKYDYLLLDKGRHEFDLSDHIEGLNYEDYLKYNPIIVLDFHYGMPPIGKVLGIKDGIVTADLIELAF